MGARKSTAADKAEARRQLAESLQASITDKVAALTDTEAWKAYLDAAQSFHDYSTGRDGVFGGANAVAQGRRSAA